MPQERSILKSVKKILGIDPTFEAFDLDIITHINSAFVQLQDLAVGPVNGFSIVDDEPTWDDYMDDDVRMNRVISYVYLYVRNLFDPPTTSTLQASIDKQIAEMEWRLNATHDEGYIAPTTDDSANSNLVLDAGGP